MDVCVKYAPLPTPKGHRHRVVEFVDTAFRVSAQLDKRADSVEGLLRRLHPRLFPDLVLELEESTGLQLEFEERGSYRIAVGEEEGERLRCDFRDCAGDCIGNRDQFVWGDNKNT